MYNSIDTIDVFSTLVGNGYRSTT